jgi:hypothetical protein
MKTKRANIITRIMGYFQRRSLERKIAKRQAEWHQTLDIYYAEPTTNQYIIKDGELIPRY